MVTIADWFHLNTITAHNNSLYMIVFGRTNKKNTCIIHGAFIIVKMFASSRPHYYF